MSPFIHTTFLFALSHCRFVQNGKGCHAAAALVPAPACARSHVHRRAVSGEGFLVDAAHGAEAVLSSVPRRRQRVPDTQVGTDGKEVGTQTNAEAR